MAVSWIVSGTGSSSGIFHSAYRMPRNPASIIPPNPEPVRHRGKVPLPDSCPLTRVTRHHPSEMRDISEIGDLQQGREDWSICPRGIVDFDEPWGNDPQILQYPNLEIGQPQTLRFLHQ